jgi:hypothetical protein
VILLLLFACSRQPAATPSSSLVEREAFAMPLPAGYVDDTAAFRKDKPDLSVVLTSAKESGGSIATIVVRKAKVPGGSFADPTTCMETGKGLVAGEGWTLLDARVVDGALGKSCQVKLKAPQGLALITELHKADNTREAPKDVWLMTCNHPEGDAEADNACSVALAGFQLR